jgi:hypothetical protein
LAPTLGARPPSSNRPKVRAQEEDEPDARKARDRRARAASKYKPETVEILLVAEAPPRDPFRYFYFEHVQEHDSLFRYVARGALNEEPTRENKPELLSQLKESGIFLIDLSLDPLNGVDLEDQVTSLAERAQALRPSRIILIKATVYDAAF